MNVDNEINNFNDTNKRLDFTEKKATKVPTYFIPFRIRISCATKFEKKLYFMNGDFDLELEYTLRCLSFTYYKQ